MIGRRKRTRKQKRMNYISGRIMRGGNTSRTRSRALPKLATGKRFQQFLKNYDEAIARGDLKPIKEIEDLRKKWESAWNKDGTPSKSKLNSKKKRDDFNKDMRDFNKKYKRWGKQAVADIAEKQRRKRDKQSTTFGEHEAERIQRERQEQGEETTPTDFYRIAQEQSEKYLRMLDLFALDSLNKLREELNIGSGVVQALASMGLSTETINKYLNDFRDAFKNIPQEARNLASEDDLNMAIVELAELHGAENLTDVLTEYIKADDEEEREAIASAGAFHANAITNGKTDTSFSEFWEEAHGTNENKWGDFL